MVLNVDSVKSIHSVKAQLVFLANYCVHGCTLTSECMFVCVCVVLLQAAFEILTNGIYTGKKKNLKA